MNSYLIKGNVHHFIYLLIISTVCFGFSSCASFYGSSFISLPLQDSKSSTIISFRFKTYQSDAVLFLAVGPIDYCLITLERAHISVRINLGSGEAMLLSKDLKLNDLIWHRVDVQRTEAELSLVIDDLHTYFLDIPGKFFELNINYGLFLGGLGNFKEVYLGELHNYRGCMEKVLYNTIEVIESSSKSNGAHQITYDCSNEFEASPSDAMSFVDSGSYAVLPGFATSVRNGGTLSFDIKTSSLIAVLFFNEGSGGHNSDFMSVEIIDGKILVSINNGDGMVVIQSDIVVSDGYWHSVRIQFSSVFLEISIDDFPARSLRPSLGDNKYFDLNDQLFVGGIETNKQSIAYKHGLQSILSEGPDSSLKGCLKNIKLGQKYIGLRDAQITQGIKSGACLWEFKCLIYTTSPCVDGAECFQEGLNDFRCLCDSAVCVRPNFTSNYKVFDAKEDEKVIDSQILQIQPLRIAEGSSALITHNMINVLIDYNKYGITENEILFRIEKPPKHGTLEVEVWDRTLSPHFTNSVGLSDNVFTLNDLITEKVRFTSDGSENRNDSIDFMLEFNSRFFHLPLFIHSTNFTFFIEIHPINDAPIITQNNSVLKLSKNTKRMITTENLSAEDEDNSSEEIRFKINTIINGDQSFIENVKNIDIPVDSFTQNDINNGLIRFVHKTKTFNNNNNKIRVLFTITDRNGETAETTLNVEVSDIELILINNTGITLAFNSFGLISLSNLSYKTNSDLDLSQYIKYEIIKESHFGSIQKLRANGFWANVSSFSQRQINRNKIRYFHFKDKPNEDILELQVSYNEIKAPVIRFQIQFKKSKLEVIALNQLTITQDMQNITISSKDLKFDTQPYSTDPNLIIYTLLSKPSFGSLHVISGNTTEELNIGSLVTQQMINDLKLLYNCSEKQTQSRKNHDSFDFEVATEGGLTNVEVTSFHFKFIRSKTDDFILINIKLVVLEGDRASIDNKHLKVETTNKVGSLHYNITNKPKFGTIKLMNSQLNDVIQVSPNIIKEEEIDENRIVYNHDDSEHNRDIFDFEVFDSQNNFICFGTFTIEVVMKNDNPPIRVVDKVFEVVTDGQKKLTADDIRYVDSDIDSSPTDIKYSKTYIPNGNLYFVDRPNEVADQFTQEDIDKGKILFKHSGDEFGRSLLWISDGQFYASGVLEIKASKPYLKVSQNTGLIVKYGESGLITTKNLSIDTNLDITRKSEITFKITSEPKLGQILNAGKETNRFTLEDLIEESIEYESKSIEDDSHVLNDWFTFRLFFNGEDYLSSRVTAENQMFNISIYPHSYLQLSLINLKNISIEEDQFVVIDSSKLLVSHQSLSAENIVYMITQLPKMGVLSLLAHNTTPIPMHFLSKDSINRENVKNENLLIFTQRDIDDNLIHYKYTGADNISEIDSFRFDVTNGITTLRELTFYINIISKLITLFTGNITVAEGQSVPLSEEDFVVSNTFYAKQIDEYLIIEEPKFGSIVCKDENNDQKVTKSFTPKLLRQGLILYSHDGSESTRDWLTVVVRVNSMNKESLPSTIHVIIDPINDEKPYVVNNTGLELWEGTSAVITNSHLAAVDDDSTTEEIVYQISTPSNGYVTTIDSKQTPIERFSQIMIDSGIILFVQRGELGGGFRFQVTDGNLISGPHVFVVTARPVVMSVIVNKKLFVFPRMQQSVTRDHLLVETNDGNQTREFTYHIMKEPKFGRFLLENSDGTTKYCLSFTQKQINENLVLYEQNKPINDILVEDQIIFDIESHFVQSLKGILFTVEIAIGNSGEDLTPEMTKLIEVNPLTVIEGQFSIISENNLNISELIKYWKNKDFNTKIIEKLYLKTQRNPFHGIILFEGQKVTKNKNIPLSALNNHQLIYKHDSSNTFNDSFIMAIYITNGIDILLSNHSLQVNIIPVNDELPILLTQNPRINVIYDSKTLISNALLRTSDKDGVTHNIIYELLTDSIITNTFGFFMVEPNEEPIDSFTQFQIDSKIVYFKHKGLTSGEKQIKFRIKDEKGICSQKKHCTQLYGLTLITRQSSLQLYNHSTVELLQGSITAKIEPKHLSVLANDIKPENIVFFIREGPINGYIIVNDKTNNEKFRQIDINSLKVSYIQINKTSSDSFVVDVMRVQNGEMHKSIENITILISIRPLVRAKKPFLIASPGYRSVITSEHLDASDLYLITNSVPKFKIKTNPKFGYLKKYSLETTKKRVKRWSKHKQFLIEFTNDDLISGQIAYIADKDLDLSYPNEIITDVIHYELSAHNVQTASGVLVVNIVDKKLWNKSNNRDIETNSSNFEDQMIEIFGENEEMNYLNIIITRDHLLIGFVSVVVVILTVALIVIIRFCQSSPIQTLHKDNKSGPITSTLSTSPVILETPPISEYGAEMLIMSHRMSPRSTPSISEMETGLMPIAPPTSPSLSTNCSHTLDTRSHTATPRSLLRLPMAGRLRGGCAAAEDLAETSTCNIYPLPPPSLYFENESNISPGDWGQSSIPLCKVSPIVPQCLQNHYHCASYHHNICPFNQNNSMEMSVRVLGDGTSLIGSPIPSLRKTPWSSDEVSPNHSNNVCVDTSPQFKSFMTYSECKSPISPNSDIYITDGFSADSLGVEHDLGQTVPKQKQQYWV